MRLGLISSAVPLVHGGGRFIVDWLASQLRARGHEVEVVLIPTTEDPQSVLIQMAAMRSMDLSAFDRVITFRPPSHVVQHPNKVAWFIHHFRVFYDLWGTDYCGMPDNAPFRALRAEIVAADTQALSEARKVFSNSKVVADRVARFNGVKAEVLYPPVFEPERFRSGDYGDEIVCVCRVEHHKRQHLLVEAMGHTRTAVRLRICGAGSDPNYLAHLRALARDAGVESRVAFELRWISEDEKITFFETALANAYVPLDEDSYGYPTLEAAHARRTTVTVADAGGVSEFVTSGLNGVIAQPTAAALAEAFDQLYEDRALAKAMGQAAQGRITELGIDWDSTIEKLLS
jgi:glycosyltransferase involved in cell wall biosynthesis